MPELTVPSDLIANLKAMDAAPSRNTSGDDALCRRLSYLLLHPVNHAPDATGTISLANERPLRLWQAYKATLAVFREIFGAPASSVWVRYSELCATPQWQALDGMDPIEVVCELEQQLHCDLHFSGGPWWEFPILEIGQQWCLSSQDYSLKTHAVAIADAVGWNTRPSPSLATLEHVACEAAALIWGIPFSLCTPETQIADLLVTNVRPSPYYDASARIEGIATILSHLFSTDRSPTSTAKIQLAMHHAAQTGQPLSMWLRSCF